MKKKKAEKRLTSEKQDLIVSRFNTAMALMSIIPLLTFVYLLANIAGLDVFGQQENFYVTIMIVTVSLSGILLGRRLMQHVIGQLSEKNAQLKQASEMKTMFLRNVAHETGTPLATTRNNLEAIHDGLYGPVNEGIKKPLNATIRQVDRLLRMIGELLDTARIEVGVLPVEFARADLTALLKEAVETVQKSFIRDVPSITFEAGVQPRWLEHADHDRLIQVTVNLLRNAVKYSDPGKPVELKLVDQGAFFEVKVLDRGYGVPPDMKERIFEAFVRADLKKTSGLGLGLVITRHIVNLHGGKLWLEDRTGGGSVFSFTLPK
jgi:signal transduction histidine kinase